MSRFDFTTAGESHGPSLTLIIRGLPAGLQIDRGRIDHELERRQGGYGRGSRMKIERDQVTVTGGLRGGETLGSPVAITITNRDFENWRPVMDPWETDPDEVEKRRLHAPRPGHTDLAGGLKYDRRDLRDILERASARETAARVAAGALAKELLRYFGIEIRSAVLSIGTAGDANASPSWEELDHCNASEVRSLDSKTGQMMIAAIDAAREAGDTLGGTIYIAARGVPPGLGSHVQWNEKLDGRIAQAVLSIHAVKAVAIGDGITASGRYGSEVHDAILWSEASGYHRETNRAGGLEGGVTNGEEVVVRAFMKPIATTRRGLASVDIDTHEAQRSQWERSDVTAVPACSVICEAMLAIILADAMREKFGGDTIKDMRHSFDAYLTRIAGA